MRSLERIFTQILRTVCVIGTQYFPNNKRSLARSQQHSLLRFVQQRRRFSSRSSQAHAGFRPPLASSAGPFCWMLPLFPTPTRPPTPVPPPPSPASHQPTHVARVKASRLFLFYLERRVFQRAALQARLRSRISIHESMHLTLPSDSNTRQPLPHLLPDIIMRLYRKGFHLRKELAVPMSEGSSMLAE